MDRHARRRFLILLLATALIAGPALSQMLVLRARFITGKGGTQEKVYTVKFEIKGYTTKDEVVQMVEALNRGGEDAFRPVFRTMDKAVMKIIGGHGLPIYFHAVQEIPKENGVEIRLIAENVGFEQGAQRRLNVGLYFMVVVLDLDLKGRGEGRVYEDSTLEFGATGELKIGEFKSAPKMLVNVRKG